jgi:hypothetical protein
MIVQFVFTKPSGAFVLHSLLHTATDAEFSFKMTFFFLVMAVALAILAVTDDMAIVEWQKRMKKEPQVYLAICYSLTNVLLSFAFAEGLVIWFWKLAARGTSVSGALAHISHTSDNPS